jgi:hypothetical protein
MSDLTERKTLLEPAGTAVVPASPESLDIRGRLEAPPGVRFSAIGAEFKKRFYGKVDCPRPGTEIRKHRLLAAAPDGPVIEELGGAAAAETTFSAAYWLIKRQGWGATGFLQTNGRANIFYVRDQNGVLCAVRAAWEEEGWTIDAVSAGDPLAWNGKHEIYCPVCAAAPA